MISLASAFLFTALAASADTSTSIVYERAEDGTYVWSLVERALPPLAPTDVLVRVRAVSLNRADYELLELERGRDRAGELALSDAAGDVIAVGSAVRDFEAGDKVSSLYFTSWVDGPISRQAVLASHSGKAPGVFGEYVVLPHTAIAHAPRHLGPEEVATLPTAALTAFMALGGGAELSGKTVLVQGTGSVSTFALDFARALGARVIATTSTPEKRKLLDGRGAFATIDYRVTPDWSAEVMKLTGGRGVDLVIDVGGKATVTESVESLAYEGTVALVGGLTGYDALMPTEGLIMKRATARGVFVGSRADYDRMVAFIERHELKPRIARVFPFAERDAALEMLRSTDVTGRIVITF